MTETKSDVDSSSGSESTDSRVKHGKKWKERKKEREEWKKEVGERREERKKEWDERKEQRKKEKEEKKKHKDHKSGHSEAGGLAPPYHPMTHSEQPQFGASNVGGYHYPEHIQQHPHHRGEHAGFHQQPSPPGPPPYVQQNPLPPPSGYRVPLTTQTFFPIDPNQTGPPAFVDADGISPIFVGSALMENSVHPCKIGPHLNPFASVPYGGGEFGHEGRFDLLPFRHDQMEWVPTSAGRIPTGRKPIEGGYEEGGNKLYHAVAVVNGVKVPGKTGEHLAGARVPFGGIEHEIYDDYEILCWR